MIVAASKKMRQNLQFFERSKQQQLQYWSLYNKYLHIDIKC